MTDATEAAAFNPFRVLADAAIGDIAAQRALADEAIRIAREDDDSDPETALREGLIFARMAASHGNAADKGRVVAMLALAAELCEQDGDHDTAEILGAEAIARVAVMADEGVELAENTIGTMADNATPGTMAMALQYQGLMREVI